MSLPFHPEPGGMTTREEFELDVVRTTRFGRWWEALVGQMLRQGCAPDELAPRAIALLGLDRETQLLMCWDGRHLRMAFEWWGNPWRILDLVTDETWTREVMQESGVGWPEVEEKDATEEEGTVE